MITPDSAFCSNCGSNVTEFFQLHAEAGPTPRCPICGEENWGDWFHSSRPTPTPVLTSFNNQESSHTAYTRQRQALLRAPTHSFEGLLTKRIRPTSPTSRAQVEQTECGGDWCEDTEDCESSGDITDFDCPEDSDSDDLQPGDTGYNLIDWAFDPKAEE